MQCGEGGALGGRAEVAAAQDAPDDHRGGARDQHGREGEHRVGPECHRSPPWAARYRFAVSVRPRPRSTTGMADASTARGALDDVARGLGLDPGRARAGRFGGPARRLPRGGRRDRRRRRRPARRRPVDRARRRARLDVGCRDRGVPGGPEAAHRRGRAAAVGPGRRRLPGGGRLGPAAHELPVAPCGCPACAGAGLPAPGARRWRRPWPAARRWRWRRRCRRRAARRRRCGRARSGRRTGSRRRWVGARWSRSLRCRTPVPSRPTGRRGCST